jgi:hypothetical protein
VTERRDEPGRIVERALESLRELAAADNDAVARIVAAAARTRAQDVAPNDDDLLLPAVPERRRWPFALAAAAIVLMFGGAIVVNIARSNSTLGPNRAAANRAVIQVVNPAANGDALPVPTQFIYDGHARHVMLVGDFNNWDERATALEREPGSTLWSVTVPIQRGRHIYAFLVDSVWTVDNRAPVANDPDFGVRGSVVLVGRP